MYGEKAMSKRERTIILLSLILFYNFSLPILFNLTQIINLIDTKYDFDQLLAFIFLHIY